MKRVIVSGMESSGSTAIWQMVNGLGLTVTKEHGYTTGGPNCLVLATFRDIRDVITSLWRRRCLGEMNDPDSYALGCMRYVAPRLEQMKRYQADENASLIRYESFISDPGYTFDVICRKLDIHVPSHIRDKILEDCSLEKNKERAATMSDFSEWDKGNLIHGNHISTDGKIGSWADLAATLKPETVETIEQETRAFLVHFNYETE